MIEYNGICKAENVPLLIHQFGLPPNERLENWWSGPRIRFRSCESGRVFVVDSAKVTCEELAPESVPDFVRNIVLANDEEIGRIYLRVDSGKLLDPDEFTAAHSELTCRGIRQLDLLENLRRETRRPPFDGL